MEVVGVRVEARVTVNVVREMEGEMELEVAETEVVTAGRSTDYRRCTREGMSERAAQCRCPKSPASLHGTRSPANLGRSNL